MHRGVRGSIATSNLMDAYCSVWLRISYPPDKAHLGVWTTERQPPEKAPKTDGILSKDVDELELFEIAMNEEARRRKHAIDAELADLHSHSFDASTAP